MPIRCERGLRRSKKFTKPEFIALIEDLDVVLRKHGITLKAICCGGFVMQMRYNSPRHTGDIDTIFNLPEEVQYFASEVGKSRIPDEHEFQQTDWINDSALETRRKASGGLAATRFRRGANHLSSEREALSALAR